MAHLSEHAVTIELPKDTTLSPKEILLHLTCESSTLVLPIDAGETVEFVDQQLRKFLPVRGAGAS